MWLQEKEGREGGQEGEGKRRQGRAGQGKEGEGAEDPGHELSQKPDQVPLPAPPHSGCVTVDKCEVLSVHL